MGNIDEKASRVAALLEDELYGNVKGSDARQTGETYNQLTDAQKKALYGESEDRFPGNDKGALDFYRRASQNKDDMVKALVEAFQNNEGALDSMLIELQSIAELVDRNGQIVVSAPSETSNPLPSVEERVADDQQKLRMMSENLEKLKLWYREKYDDELKILGLNTVAGVVIEDKGAWNKHPGTHRFRLSNDSGYNSEDEAMLASLGFELVPAEEGSETLVLKWSEPRQSSEQTMDERQVKQTRMERDLGLLISAYEKKFGYDMRVLATDLEKGVLIEDRGGLFGTRDGRNRENLIDRFQAELEKYGFTLVQDDPNSRELILKWQPH
jgi:hypothetical protein